MLISASMTRTVSAPSRERNEPSPQWATAGSLRPDLHRTSRLAPVAAKRFNRSAALLVDRGASRRGC